MPKSHNYDVIIIGAGAAGMMCAIEAGKRGRRVLVLDKAGKAGSKILISGGGKCNFTNLYLEADNYLSNNPHFCKSALSRYTQWDFIALMAAHGLPWEEREHGQLFGIEKANTIVDMLLDECRRVAVEFRFFCDIEKISKHERFRVQARCGQYRADSLVIATGGPSIPRMGSTDFGLRVAKQFGLKSIPFRAALVPFTFEQKFINRYLKGLAGHSQTASITCNGRTFREQLLITHRGLSGPVVLQISSYWQKGDKISVDLCPDREAAKWLLAQRQARPNSELKTLLAESLSRRFARRLCDARFGNRPLKQYSQDELQAIGRTLNAWQIQPSGTEGMRTAEVSTGGVDTHELSSKTMEARKLPGLYFIGETVDVTGHLGGYNFQWAWASGWVAGQNV